MPTPIRSPGRPGPPPHPHEQPSRISLVHPKPGASRPSRRRRRPRSQQPGDPDQPRHSPGGAWLAGRSARFRLGSAGHLYRRRGAHRAHHHLRALDRHSARLLAPGPLRRQRRDAGRTDRRPRAGQHRVRPGQPRGLRRQRGRPGAALRPHPRVHAARSPAVDRGKRQLRGRALPGDRLHRRPAHPGPRRTTPSQALFRRRLGGGRARVGDRVRRPAVLGRAARRTSRRESSG